MDKAPSSTVTALAGALSRPSTTCASDTINKLAKEVPNPVNAWYASPSAYTVMDASKE